MAGYYAEFVVNVNNIGTSRKPSSKKKKKTTENIKSQNNNLKRAYRFASINALSVASALNSYTGAYTGNKVKQANVTQGIKYTGMVLTAISNPYIALGVLAIDTVNNVLDYNIRVANAQQESDYKTSLVGNMATSNSRWRGNYK